MTRQDGRKNNQLRPIKIQRNYLKYPEGSALIEMGETKVICTASVVNSVPNHKKGQGEGWITAEYAMLPRATNERSQREHFQVRGRSQEIQRLIGRSLRAVFDLKKLGERTIYIDTDVLQADGGTRTAAITGSFVALKDAVAYLLAEKKITQDPLAEYLAAVSVGLVDGAAVLDLPYAEDVKAATDMNVVMTESGKFIEVQGTAESAPFTQDELDQLLGLAKIGIKNLIKKQKEALNK